MLFPRTSETNKLSNDADGRYVSVKVYLPRSPLSMGAWSIEAMTDDEIDTAPLLSTFLLTHVDYKPLMGVYC